MSNVIKTSFNGGVFTPKIDVRIDTDKYASGCRLSDNMIPTIFGGATRRPGTKLIVVGNGAGCYYEPPTADPTKIQITTPQELQDIQNDLSGDYELMNNLDMTGFDWQGIGFWQLTPAPQVNPFTGTFDGNYFTISNLTFIDAGVPFGIGLFKFTSGATISNTVVEDVNFATGSFSGGFAGHPENTTFTNCRVTGVMNIAFGESQMGGFAGSTGVGDAGNTYTRCSADVDVLTTGGVGAVNRGGFGGGAGSTFIDCYSTGDVKDDTNQTGTGTFVGGFLNDVATPLAFTNCYSTGEIGYSAGAPDRRGGFLGEGASGETISSCYWDTDTSGFSDGIGNGAENAELEGKTTAQMYQEATFETFDFSDVWEIDENADYPRHQWQRLADIKQVCKRL